MAVNAWVAGINTDVWKFKGSCGCSPKVYTYKKDNYELKVTPTRSIFKVFQKNTVIHSGTLSNMVDYLNTI